MTRILDSGSLPQALAAARNKAGALLSTGQVTAVDGSGNVTVSLGGTPRTASLLTAMPVRVGDNVQLLRQGAQLIILGPVVPAARPVTGTVASAPSNSYTIIVTTSLGSLACEFVAAYTPTVGDTVFIGWSGTRPIVLGKQGKTGSPPAPPAPTPPPIPDPPPPPPTTGTTTFQATQSGSYRSGEWRNDANGNVIQGTAPGFAGENFGAWFYGGRVHSSLHGKTVLRIQIALARVSGGNYGNQTVHLYRITNDRRPSGNVTFTATDATASLEIGESGWFTLPDAFGQALVDSGGSVGIQSSSGPYVRLKGLPNTSQAGALRISWSS